MFYHNAGTGKDEVDDIIKTAAVATTTSFLSDLLQEIQ